MKLDILAFGAHPDDIELGCGGTILKHINAGYSVGIIDLTKGSLELEVIKILELKKPKNLMKF